MARTGTKNWWAKRYSLLTLVLDQVAEGYWARDERRAIKKLLRPDFQMTKREVEKETFHVQSR
jgi:hypothetical protein